MTHGHAEHTQDLGYVRYTAVSKCKYMVIYAHTHTHTRAHTHMYKDTHTHTHIHI